MNAQQPAPAEQKAPEVAPTSVKGTPPAEARFAVYDTEHERFVGPVVDKKSDATSDARDRSKATGRKHEVREV